MKYKPFIWTWDVIIHIYPHTHHEAHILLTSASSSPFTSTSHKHFPFPQWVSTCIFIYDSNVNQGRTRYKLKGLCSYICASFLQINTFSILCRISLCKIYCNIMLAIRWIWNWRNICSYILLIAQTIHIFCNYNMAFVCSLITSIRRINLKYFICWWKDVTKV